MGGTAPTYWTLGGTAVGSTNSAQDGSVSMRITPPTSGASARQTITIQNGATYTVSVWIATVGVSGATAVFDTNDKYDSTCQFLVGGTTGWTKYTGSFTATNTSVTLRMFASNTNFAGTAYFDNVVLASANASNVAPVITSVPRHQCESGCDLQLHPAGGGCRGKCSDLQRRNRAFMVVLQRRQPGPVRQADWCQCGFTSRHLAGQRWPVCQ